MQAGKTIAAKRERVAPDSERERVRRVIHRKKILAMAGVILFAGLLIFLAVKAFQEWVKWATNREEVVIVEREPSVEVIDERTGKVFDGSEERKLSAKMKEYIANLEEEMVAQGRKVTRARIPADKIREVDVEVEGFTGVIKVSTDRNPAVSAEDAARMLKYLEGQGISEVSYIDVRVERKGDWK